MKIVAVRARQYLLEVDTDTEQPQGRILDADARKLYPPMLIHSLLARGYWQAYAGDQSELEGLLRDVEQVTNAE